MTRAISVYPALSLILMGTLWADDPAFRLAGIIAPDDGRAIALIELPTGEQQLVRTGDSIGDALVAVVTKRYVRLELPEGDDVVLELAPSDQDRPYAPPAPVEHGPVMIDAEGRARLETLIADASGLDDEGLARRLAQELRLRTNQRIATVNNRPVEDWNTAVRAIARELSSGGGGKLVVSFAEPTEEQFRVYYFVDTPEDE